MWDFLTFKHFITQDVLILAYYIGAVLMPLAMWWSRHYLIGKFSVFSQLDLTRQHLFDSLSSRNKALIIIAFIIIFLMMELIWRMMFETMIGYFQMHNYLQSLSISLEGVKHE